MKRYFTSADGKGSWGLLQRCDLLVRSVMARGVDRGVGRARPSLPPVLLCGLCAWVGCAATFTWLRGWSVGVCWVLVTLAGIACTCVAFSLLRVRWQVLFLSACLGVALGVAAGAGGAAFLNSDVAEASAGDVDIVAIEMLDDARAGSYGSYGTARAYTAAGKSYQVRVLFDADAASSSGGDGAGHDPLFGEVYEVSGSLSPVDDEYAESNWQRGLCGSLSVSSMRQGTRHDWVGAVVGLRQSAVSAIRQATGDDDAKAVLAALVCGYRVDLYESSVYDDFKVVGLAHLVAVSGAHLSLVSMMLGALLRVARLPKRLTTALQTALIVGFLVFAGLPISAIRAAIMTLAGLFAFLARRRGSSLNAMGLCIMAVVVVQPESSVSVSFALSALSVLGIIIFTPLFTSWLADLRFSWVRKAGESVATTLAASLLSTPYSACLFCQLPLVSPVANLVSAPLFTVVCGLGVASACLSAFAPSLGAVPLGLAVGACDILCQCITALAHLPYASVPFEGSTSSALVLTAIAAGLLWVRWPRLRLAGAATIGFVGVCIALACMFVAPAGSGAQIVALDVGQGDAILVRNGDQAVLVDTGNEPQMLLEALAREGVYHLDAVVITHGDDDHMGSLDSLAGIVQVDRVVICKYAFTCSCDNCARLVASARELVGSDRVVGFGVGDALSFGAARMRVIWPEEFADEGGNADSLCMIASFDVDADGSDDATALLCGDAEDTQLDAMLSSGALGQVDIYKVGHHGSRKAIDDATARALSPKIALVSVGAHNSYGHPVASTLQSLRSAGAAVYRTDEQGDLTCSITADAITVTTQK